MVVASARHEKIRVMSIPSIDLAHQNRSHVVELVLKACEEYGFFKVVNHGIPKEVIERIEAQGKEFFARPGPLKQQAGPADPLGYGCKNIGFNGDQGELEYLLLHTDRASISQRSNAISNDPEKFCCEVNDYVGRVRELACGILELLSEGLRIQEEGRLAGLIRDAHNDSLLRLNHYPCWEQGGNHIHDKPPHLDINSNTTSAPSHPHRVGFGEHTDPQLLTLLTSNAVGGLQISPHPGVWVPVPSDPTALYVNVGDALQALTNGRLVSVRHRAMANSYKSRLSIIFFAAPPLHAPISPLPEMTTPQNPSLYRKFTWGEFKMASYAKRLGDSRLELFKADNSDRNFNPTIF